MSGKGSSCFMQRQIGGKQVPFVQGVEDFVQLPQ